MFLLDKKGLLLSSFFGILLYFFGGLNSLIIMFVFLFSSVWVTKFGYFEKKEMGVYEYRRGWKNVFSNGIVPIAFVIYYYYTNNPLPFLASVASVTADKFSSELGIFDEPFEVLTLKKVRRGTNGGISFLGIFASLIGSSLIALASLFLFKINYLEAIIITIAGVIGSLLDSVAGFFEERGLGNKEISNIIGSLGGALSALLLKELIKLN